MILLLLLTALLWTGCAGSSQDAASVMPSSPEMAMPAIGGAWETVAESGVGLGMDGSLVNANRQIIATAEISLVVADTERVYGEIEGLMGEVGGYVANTNLYKSGDAQLLRGNVTLRVPAQSLPAVLDRLAEMSVSVNARNVNRQDVTDQYADVDAQLRNLQATETELLALLTEVRQRPNAGTEDILAVYRNLTEIRGQIERLQGQKNLLDDQIALSTVHVSLTPDALNRPLVEQNWRPGAVMREALRALTATAQFLGTLFIWFGVYLLPLLLALLLPFILLFWLGRRVLARRKQRSASQPSA
jgi:hypothetical protein